MWWLGGVVAQAADPSPALMGFSARPDSEISASVHGFSMVLSAQNSQNVNAGGLRGRVPVGRRVSFEVLGAGYRGESCSNLRGVCSRSGGGEIVGRLGVSILEGSHVRVTPYAGLGTLGEAGVALWWSPGEGRVELDLSASVAWDMRTLIPGAPNDWEDVENDGQSYTSLQPAWMLPEGGVTVHLDTRDIHHLRIGQLGPMPTMTYRFEPGPVSMEVTFGTILFVSVGQFGLGVAF